MEIGIPILCTILGVAISVATFYIGRKKDVKQETQKDTERIVRIDEKLDTIKHNVDEIRLDNKDFSKTLSQLGERVTIVEQSTKSAHHRIDNLEDLHRNRK